MPAPNVAYSVQPAESTGFAPASFDAVCVAQALHWFDLDRFYAEVKRVLRPRGVIVVTGYGWQSVAPEFDRALLRAVIEPIQPLWPPQNALIINAYRDVAFPFERLEFPKMAIEVRWTFAQMMAYIGTWTATRRMLEKDPEFFARSTETLRQAWGVEAARTVTMPLTVLCGRHA